MTLSQLHTLRAYIIFLHLQHCQKVYQPVFNDFCFVDPVCWKIKHLHDWYLDKLTLFSNYLHLSLYGTGNCGKLIFWHILLSTAGSRESRTFWIGKIELESFRAEIVGRTLFLLSSFVMHQFWSESLWNWQSWKLIFWCILLSTAVPIESRTFWIDRIELKSFLAEIFGRTLFLLSRLVLHQFRRVLLGHKINAFYPKASH